MKKVAKLLFLLLPLVPAVVSADYAADKKKYDECVAKVKKDYPVPPGNVNARNQLIKNECGEAPTPPKPPKN